MQIETLSADAILSEIIALVALAAFGSTFKPHHFDIAATNTVSAGPADHKLSILRVKL